MISSSYSSDKPTNRNHDKINNIEKNNHTCFFTNSSHRKHLISKPPKEAYFYFPKENEIYQVTIAKDNKKIINRKFFDGSIMITQFEKEKLIEFFNFCKNSDRKNFDFESFIRKISVEDKYNDITTSLPILKTHENENCKNQLCIGEIYRFLLSYQFENEKTLSAIIEVQDFWNKYFPIKISENIKKILLSGFIYIFGRDNRYRPIIILRPSIFLDLSKKNKELKYEDWMLSVVYLLDYCINYLLIPGQVEHWNIICDMNNVSLYSVPNDLKNLLGIIQNNYKFRLNKMFVLNLSTFAGILWSVIKGLMGENVQKKIKMINSKNNYAELYDSINRSQLENKYGGFAKNISLNYDDYVKFNSKLNQDQITSQDYSQNTFYYPPFMPSIDYLTEIDKEEIYHILLTEEDYLSLIKKNKFIYQSPYYANKSEENLSRSDKKCLNNDVMSQSHLKINNENTPNKDKMLRLRYKDSHLVFNEEEEYFSVIDHLSGETSKFSRRSSNQGTHKEILQINLTQSESFSYSNNKEKNIISFKKYSKYNAINLNKEAFEESTNLNKQIDKNKQILDLSNKNSANKTMKKYNKVIIKRDSNLGKNDKSVDSNLCSLESKSQEYEINEEKNSKFCKMSCGKIKVECSIF